MSRSVAANNGQSLVKKTLDVSVEGHGFPRGELKRVTATYGCGVEKAASLIVKREFSGYKSVPGLRGQFYATPNPKSSDLNIDTLGGDGFDLYDWEKIDAVGAAIGYASTYDTSTHIADDRLARDAAIFDHERGVVITFGGGLSLRGAEINVDPNPHIDESHGIELVLPEPPKFEAIRGIYPIDQASANELMNELAQVVAGRAA